MKFNIFILTILICYGCNQSEYKSNKVEERYIFNTLSGLENAWMKGDKKYIINFIDSLSSMDTLDFLTSVYHFSEVSGFGVALIDVYDNSYYLQNDINEIFKRNVIGLINTYKESKYFFKQPCETILVHQYCDIFNSKLNKDSCSILVDKMFKKVDCYVHWNSKNE